MQRLVLPFATLLALFVFSQGCGGDAPVSIPGCDDCPDTCLLTPEEKIGRCVPCLEDKHCQSKTTPTQTCSSKNQCVCGSDKDCPSGKRCKQGEGCFPCLSNEDCASKDNDKPACVANQCETCAPGKTRPCGTSEDTCKKGTQTCADTKSWGECVGALVCGEGEKCEKEACVPDCPPAPCKEDERTCLSAEGAVPGTYKVCVKDQRGCFAWSEEKTCGEKDVCSKGQCIPYTCPPAECVEKNTQCDGDNGVKTCVKNKLGCLVWSTTAACKSSQSCQKSLQKCAVCNPKDSRPCYSADSTTKGIGLCKAGQEICKDDGSGYQACAGEVVPGKELCDGKDNDCDGKTDEDFARVGQACNVGQGECAASGKFQCSKDGSKVECSVKAGSSSKEICDGKDNDCDGKTDEDFANQGNACSLGKGECAAKGTFVCKPDKTGTVCDAKPSQAASEVCNNKDDDCDGSTDESLSRSCYSGSGSTKGVGSCKGGSQTCTKGLWSSCVGEVTPKTETCNGKDDDCDGKVDNQAKKVGETCAVSGVKGLCAASQFSCVAGQLRCMQVVQPSLEVCNGKDDNCDGLVDNGASGVGGSCTVSGKQGLCAKGEIRCAKGSLACTQTVSPVVEACDGKDNDCDGSTDEGCPCNYLNKNAGVCKTARLDTKGVCTKPSSYNTREVCGDQLDNDCDGVVDEGCPCNYLNKAAGVCKTAKRDNQGVCLKPSTYSATEICDKLDNNCDGVVDVGTTDLWLGALKPTSTKVGWGSYWVDKSWYAAGFRVGGKFYPKGVFAHAPSRLVYNLCPSFKTFSACVGLEDGDGNCGNGVRFRVLVDGKEKYKSGTVSSGQAARCFSVSVQGARTLELLVDNLGSTVCDESCWVNALLKK